MGYVHPSLLTSGVISVNEARALMGRICGYCRTALKLDGSQSCVNCGAKERDAVCTLPPREPDYAIR